jgi:hypothetical protein
MIFDLKGKRRTTVQGVYLTLAILMGAGLVFFGIGSSVSGGLSDLFGGGGGGSTAEKTAQKKIDSAEKSLQTNPNDTKALADLVRQHYALANASADPTSGQPSGKTLVELKAAGEAWQRYLDAAEKPDKGLAGVAFQAYDTLAASTEDPQDQKPFYSGAAGAVEILTEGSKQPAPYVRLVQYATLAGQTRKAELAGKRAIELAPKKQKKQIQQAVEQAKAPASTQGQQTPAP